MLSILSVTNKSIGGFKIHLATPQALQTVEPSFKSSLAGFNQKQSEQILPIGQLFRRLCKIKSILFQNVQKFSCYICYTNTKSEFLCKLEGIFKKTFIYTSSD
jgi:hypothetical protein